jgi:hypothetical protein
VGPSVASLFPLRCQGCHVTLPFARNFVDSCRQRGRLRGVLSCDLTLKRGHIMRRLATLVVVAALLSPPTASGQYTFGDWARDQGYSPGDVMHVWVDARESSPAIDSLDGIGQFDWTATPTTELILWSNTVR